MFDTLNTTLINLALGIAKLGGASMLLSLIVLAIMNMWGGAFDPRMAQGIKGNMVRVAISGAIIAAASAAGAAGMMALA